MSEVEFGRHAFGNDHREANIGAEAVHGFNKDGRWHDPRDAPGKHDPRVHRLDFKVGCVVHRERNGDRAVTTVVGSGDGQFVIPAGEIHGVHDHCPEVVDGQLLIIVHQRGVLCIHRSADVHGAVEFVEADHVHPCSKR